jgi:hypothetical protein
VSPRVINSGRLEFVAHGKWIETRLQSAADGLDGKDWTEVDNLDLRLNTAMGFLTAS